eukprot:m.292720 g.292720  ORF g.292720 m.292720 type:complete len:54 (-) comp20008_c0_seq1:1664-1825(-)
MSGHFSFIISLTLGGILGLYAAQNYDVPRVQQLVQALAEKGQEEIDKLKKERS